VKKAIYSEPSLKVMDISVSTEGGVVELTGSVKSRAERFKAGQVAAKVEGVKKVNNQLKVVSQ
jgi:osmotically-inducible protein OsmY